MNIKAEPVPREAIRPEVSRGGRMEELGSTRATMKSNMVDNENDIGSETESVIFQPS